MSKEDPISILRSVRNITLLFVERHQFREKKYRAFKFLNFYLDSDVAEPSVSVLEGRFEFVEVDTGGSEPEVGSVELENSPGIETKIVSCPFSRFL